MTTDDRPRTRRLLSPDRRPPTADRRNAPARPVLKWVGGKGQLLRELLARLPQSFKTYHEPFTGGGALFFELAAQGRITTAYLSDANPSLIDVYLGLRDCVDEVIAVLRQHRYEHDYYYYVRALRPTDLSLPERAARIIYLNKTCYNGLYRENRRGEFNVPFGRYKNPTICDEPNLRAASAVLQGVNIARRPFDSTLDYAKRGDFVYFDPPYHPVSATANFTSYDRDGFGPDNQRRLRDAATELRERGVTAMVSNSDTPFIRELYAGFHIDQVQASRAVNSKANGRGKVAELIIRNY